MGTSSLLSGSLALPTPMLAQIIEYLFPPPSLRIPLTGKNWASCLIPHVSMLFMACLARRKGTWLLRLALVPLLVPLTLRMAFGYAHPDPELNGLNHALGAGGFCIAIIIAHFGLTTEGVLKLNEIAPGVYKKASTTSNGLVHSNGVARLSSPPNKPLSLSIPGEGGLVSFLYDGLELVSSVRGIGWKFGTGTGVFLPKDWRDTSNRRVFLWQTFWSFLFHIVASDLLQSTVKALVPDLWDHDVSMFGRGSNLFESLAISTAIHCAGGLWVVFHFMAASELFTLFAVTLLNSQPSSWPPIFDQPWLSTSLHEFWGSRWHSLFRAIFLFAGGYPLRALLSPLGKFASQAGFLIGTFAASGLIHDVGFWGSGRMPGWHSWGFFLAQSVALGLERAWRTITGRRVGGWAGWVWVILCIVGGGQWCIDAWIRSGFLRDFIPPDISPSHRIIFPMFKHLATLLI